MTPTAPELDPAESLDHRLQAAVLAALDTLVALASNRDEPNQARLAAAEILRFAARRKQPAAPEATPQRLPAPLAEPPEPAESDEAPEPGRQYERSEPAHHHQHMQPTAPERAGQNQPPGRTPAPQPQPTRRDPFSRSARKRKRDRQRAATAQALPRS